MSLQVVTHGSHQQIVNGKNIVNKHYGVSVDSNRAKSKQVNAVVVNDNKQYKFQDSLEHFLRKMSSPNSSLFNLLEKEKNLSKLSNPHYNFKLTNETQPNKAKKKSKQIKQTRKANKKGKPERQTRKANQKSN